MRRSIIDTKGLASERVHDEISELAAVTLSDIRKISRRYGVGVLGVAATLQDVLLLAIEKGGKSGI